MPQWEYPGIFSGILVPAAPVNLYQPGPFQSGLTLLYPGKSRYIPFPELNSYVLEINLTVYNVYHAGGGMGPGLY